MSESPQVDVQIHDGADTGEPSYTARYPSRIQAALSPPEALDADSAAMMGFDEIADSRFVTRLYPSSIETHLLPGAPQSKLLKPM
jgi:hypothetical protein